MVLAGNVDVAVSPYRAIHVNGGDEVGGVLSDCGGRGRVHY